MQNKMTVDKAIKIVKNYQDWRLGKTDDIKYDRSLVTQAINIVLNEIIKTQQNKTT